MADSSVIPPTPIGTRVTAGARQALLTGVAASLSYASSSLLGLPEGFWAAISSIVVMQSQLTDTETSGRDRFVGTAIGGLVAWGCAVCWHQHLWIYAAAVGLSVFVCWVANVSGAGRLAGVAVSVIVLIPRPGPVWKIALFRILEVSWGIAVALATAALFAAIARRWTLMRTSRRLTRP